MLVCPVCPYVMVSEEEIRSEGLTGDDVIDREFVRPEEAPTDVYWPDYFDDHPESRPADDVRIEERDDGTPVMKWTDGEFEVELEGVEKEAGFPGGDWRATIHLPKSVGVHFFDEHEIKCHYPPMLGDQPEGYVEEVVTADSGYRGEAIVLRLKDAEGMPLVLVESYPDMLRKEAEASAEQATKIQKKLDAAHENEE